MEILGEIDWEGGGIRGDQRETNRFCFEVSTFFNNKSSPVSNV